MKINKLPKQQVESASLIDLLGKLVGGFLNNMARDLEREKWEVEQSGSNRKDGSTIWDITTGGGHKLKVKIIPANPDETSNISDPDFKEGESFKKQYFFMHFKAKDDDDKLLEKRYRGVPGDKLTEAVTKVVEKWFPGEATETGVDRRTGEDAFNPTDASSSKKLDATFKRVVGNKNDEIHLLRVMANYGPSDVLNDIQSLLNSDALVAEIGEEPVSYSVTDSGDSYDVNPSQSMQPDTSVTYDKILASAWRVFCALYFAKYNFYGPEFVNMRNHFDEQLWRIKDVLDSVYEMRAACGTNVKHPLTYLSDASYGDDVTFTNSHDCLVRLQAIVRDFVACLELYYCNLEHDDQAILDMWIHQWKLECEYELAKMIQE